MLKKTIILFVISLIFTLAFSACSSESGLGTSDREIADKKFDEVIDAIKNGDKDRLSSLFSKNAINGAENFDESVDELLDYVQGDIESYSDWSGALTVDRSSEEDEVVEIIEASYEVKTSEGDYRFAIVFFTSNTTEQNDVGIWSLYVIRKTEDTNPSYAYWGDGKNTPGINVDVKNEI